MPHDTARYLNITDDGVGDQLDGGDEQGTGQHHTHGHLRGRGCCSFVLFGHERSPLKL